MCLYIFQQINQKKFIGSGSDKNYACIKAAITALKYFKDFRHSMDSSLLIVFENIVHELRERLHKFREVCVFLGPRNRQNFKIIIEANTIFFLSVLFAYYYSII